MAEIMSGAALGAVAGEILKAIVALAERASHFKSVLDDIRSKLQFIIHLIQQLGERSDFFLDDPKNTHKYLSQLLGEGKQLIFECDGITGSVLKYPKAPFYTKKLRRWDAQLKTATDLLLLELSVEQRINCSCRSALYSDPLQLVFYHDKQLKGKAGPNLAESLMGKVLEYTKCDSDEGSVKTNPEERSVGERIGNRMKEMGEEQYEKIFHRTFDTVGGEKLKNWFRCDMFWETGPVKGVVYVSTVKLAFCSKKLHLPHKKNKHYLKVIILFQQLKDVKTIGDGTSGMNNNPSNECIKLISVDNQEFELINFRNYHGAKKCLEKVRVALPPPTCARCTRIL